MNTEMRRRHKYILSGILLILISIALILEISIVESIDENVLISYKNNNMTIEFKSNYIIIGQATLKSHNTYDEIREVTIGKNKTVVWYEFSGFKDIQENVLREVEFIDMRKEILNYTGKELLEKDEVSKYIIPNPNYLLPVEKDYKFVYMNETGSWFDYNSFNIPKENIVIGIQTDLFWGEFLDVRLKVFNISFDRHAVVLGTSAGFVTTSPIDDPLGIAGSNYDNTARVMKVTSPATATKITEIGWWCDTATEASNFEVGLYEDGGTDNATTLLYVDNTNAKGTTDGWKKVVVDWDISPSTIYWLAYQIDDTATGTSGNYASTGGAGLDYKTGSTLPTPFNGGEIAYGTRVDAIYAVWESTNTGFKSPTATGEDYNQWTNPTYAYADGGGWASETTTGEEQDYYNFNFGVPAGAIINGVEVAVTGGADGSMIINGDSVRVKIDISDNGGTTYGTKIIYEWMVGVGFFTTYLGGPTDGDAYWGLTLTDTDFSNANFRVRVEMDRLTGGATGFLLDHIQVKVYYIGGGVADCWSYGTYGYYIPKNCTCYISGNAQILNLSNAYCWSG